MFNRLDGQKFSHQQNLFDVVLNLLAWQGNRFAYWDTAIK